MGAPGKHWVGEALGKRDRVFPWPFLAGIISANRAKNPTDQAARRFPAFAGRHAMLMRG